MADILSYGATPDGSADSSAAVNAALAEAEVAGGGVIYFPPGTYRCDSRISLSSNVALKGAGVGASVIDTSKQKTNWIANIDWQGPKNLIVEDITFQGNAGRVAYITNAQNVWVNRCQFSGYHWGALRFGACNSVRITNCDFSDVQNDQDGLNYGVIAFLDKCRDFVIDGNICSDVRQGSGVACIGCSRGHIANNIIKFDPVSTTTMGVWLKSACSDLVVSGNYIEEAGAEGVIVVSASESDDSSGIIISNNRIRNCNYGIAANAWGNYVPKSLQISGNIITVDEGLRQTVGIRLASAADCVVGNNVIAGAMGAGIYIFGSRPKALRHSVGNNKIAGCDVGLRLSALYSTFTSNSINGCIIGIEAHSVVGCVFTGNIIANCKRYGRNATGPSAVNYEGALWQDNVMAGNAIDFKGAYWL